MEDEVKPGNGEGEARPLADAPPPEPAGLPPASSPVLQYRSARTTAAWLGGAVALISVLVFAGWRLTARSRPAAGLPAPPGTGDTGAPGALAQGNFNVVLQVRAQDPDGGMASVGTTLPHQLSLVFTDGAGKSYVEKFDRVGLWAIEMPAGTYWIAPVQEGLGDWKWKVAGDTVVRDGARGWKFSLVAGTVNPMIELTLH
jgi:hypothetical protein